MTYQAFFKLFSKNDFSAVGTDTDVAPLWDPSKRVFVAMMTISDYVQALQVRETTGYLLI
jgi:hypothetical protein